MNAEFFAAHVQSYNHTTWFNVDGQWKKRDTMLDRSDHFGAFCAGGEPGLPRYTRSYVEQQTRELIR